LPRTAVLEAVIAHSDHPGFANALRGAPLLTPVMRRAASRLWRDHLPYAERLYQLRSGRPTANLNRFCIDFRLAGIPLS
jgi:Domain of unknown function (DUF5914)